MNISEKLIQSRKAKGWSQEELAERLGVSRQAVSRWETGTALPDAGNILALSRLYNVTADYLLDDDHSGYNTVNEQFDYNSTNCEPPGYVPEGGHTGGEDRAAEHGSKTILCSNLTLIAIIAQASLLNAAAQPWVGEGADASLVIAVKLIPLLMASIWMASNHRYEIDMVKRARNTKIEMYYCMCQAAVAAAGYIKQWTWQTTVLILSAEIYYIFVVNPKYMDRRLVRRKQ